MKSEKQILVLIKSLITFAKVSEMNKELKMKKTFEDYAQILMWAIELEVNQTIDGFTTVAQAKNAAKQVGYNWVDRP